MSLKNKLSDAQKTAMRTKDKLSLTTLRMLLAEVRNCEIDCKCELSDTQILEVLAKLIKQRCDAAEQFNQAGRPDLADKEQAEAQVLKAFLPTQFSHEQIKQHIEQAINATQANCMSDMGKVMQQLKPKLQGRADMAEVSQQVKSALSST